MVNSFIARKDLDTEMTVVRNEMESGENDPQRILIAAHAWPAMYQWHNYGKSTIGARSDVENVDIPRLQAFYRSYYQPDNATLIVSGKFDPQQVLGWVQAIVRRASRARSASCRRCTRSTRCRTASAASRCAASAACRCCSPATTRRRRSHADYAAVELLAKILRRRAVGAAVQAAVENAARRQPSAAAPGTSPIRARCCSAPSSRRGRTSTRRARLLLATVRVARQRAGHRPRNCSAREGAMAERAGSGASPTPRTIGRRAVGGGRRRATGACSSCCATACAS